MSVVANFFDSITPPIDLGYMAERAYTLGSTQALWAGGKLLAVGFLWRLIGEIWNLICGRPYGFGRLFVQLVFWCALFAAYRPLTAGIIQLVSHLGTDLGEGALLHETFARRLYAFQRYSALHHQNAPLGGLLTRAGLATLAMEGITYVLYVAVQAAAFIIKTIQLFTLATIIAFGPVLLGFSSLSPFFSSLGMGWFWALVEVSAWSFTMDVMLFIFDKMGRDIPQDFIFAQEIVICAVILVGLLAIPQITSMLVRGHGAAAVGQMPLMMAVGGAFVGGPSAAKKSGQYAHAATVAIGAGVRSLQKKMTSSSSEGDRRA